MTDDFRATDLERSMMDEAMAHAILDAEHDPELAAILDDIDDREDEDEDEGETGQILTST